LGFWTKEDVIAIKACEVAPAYSQSGTITIDRWMTGIDKVFGREWSFGVIKVTTNEGRSALSLQKRV